MIQQLLTSTKIKSVMAPNVITVQDSDEFHVVHDKFVTHDIRHLPVLNDAGCVVGLISQRQLFKIHSPRRLEDGSWYYDKDMLDGFILKNVMVKEPLTMTPDQTLKEAMYTMTNLKLGCIPVTDQYRLPMGIITRSDILKFFLNHE